MLTKDVMNGIATELRFWKWFVQQKNFIEGWIPSDRKTPDLRPEIYNYFLGLDNIKNLKVLDIGSGVISVLNGTFPLKNITTVDPLGALYSIIFDYERYGHTPPISCGGEEIDFEASFDIVHISNAIDHSQNPSEVFRRMKIACKPEGLIVVQGFVNEAIEENWRGFHQWNFQMKPTGQVVYSGRDMNEIYLDGGLQVFTALSSLSKKDWFISVWKNI